MIPMHPEAVPGSPDELRWVVPADALTVLGPVVDAPVALSELLGEVVREVVVEPGAVRVALARGRTWRADGPSIRSALSAALADPGGWVVRHPTDADGSATGAAGGSDDALREGVRAALEGAAGDYVRSHGGRIELVDVREGIVEVDLAGACANCPGSRATLTHQVEAALRGACPGVVGVRRVDAAPARRGLLFPTIGRRRT